MEGSVVGSAGCVVQVNLHAWGVSCVVGCCNVQCSCYTEHGRYGLSCPYAETMVMSLNFIAAEHGRSGSMEDSGVSNAEYLVHLVHMNRLEGFVVCIVGKMAQDQDVGMV